ncbi:ABC transporter permease [Rhabdochlamydiaceae symbiont of Dictyostelium giganteum]|uniref:ABC transporter permease n=1 Tax=Rhabdochlamydiaceae symbiont of Dictyostelium giganteum TaxID=3342349 RepID=UPI00384EE0F8
MNKQQKFSYFTMSWHRFKSQKNAVVALTLLLILFIMAIIGPFFSKYTYYETHLPLKNRPPSWMFWFGSDELGRDIFTRVWWGARISLFVGLMAASIDLFVGVVYGSIAGRKRGRIDECMMRIADIIYSIPYLLVVILLTVVLEPGLYTIIIALSLTGWIPMARVTRAQILYLQELDYAQAAIALGASNLRLLFRHLLPNAMGPIITTMTFTIPSAIFAEAFLSFLGLGVQAPIASWGTMASDGLSALRYYPWRLFFPAFFISLTMLCFNIIGDGVRNAFDPRLKR